MKDKKALTLFLLAYAISTYACVYIVLPENLNTPEPAESNTTGWNAIVTNLAKTDAGDLHIDLTVRNDTGDWSAMKTIGGESAVLTSNGKSLNCDTVYVGTGGHRLAPGFQMRGYIAGTKSEPSTQMIYVECKGAEVVSGSMLFINYSYVTGQYNYYEQDTNKAEGTFELNLDDVVSDLSYPIGEPVDGLIQPANIEIAAINKLVLSLVGAKRTDTGLQFTWSAVNPSDYPSYVHNGIPPVIGSDGILYGFYETPDLATVPLVPAGDKAEWTTDVALPQDVDNLYIMLSVESGKARLFTNYAIDISDK
ncbi:MAG: hypothetical protein HYU84_10535 [Chloroflexi bacterium]|nr:hypothetical protein [Chloroflexota bacterium]MBI3170956.1 hypothetical protein [Chloroflexota bacterium]